MNQKQKDTIVNAYLDLIGAMEDNYGRPHDWSGHLMTVKEMSEVFKDILEEYDAPTGYFDDLITGKINSGRCKEVALSVE